MNKNRRTDILSLNFKDIRKSLPSVLQTKLIVSKESQDNEPLPQNIIKPWMLSLSNQTFVSREKVGQELLHHCRHGFVLDDPYIRRTRFYVDYHRMHDPGLKKYYTSLPVRNRIKKLELITKEDDAICTNKEFLDYIRYLDTNISYNLNSVKKLEEEKKLTEHFKQLQDEKEHESQFTGIFRRKKHTNVDKVSKAYLDEGGRMKLRKLLKTKNKAIERANKWKEDRTFRVRERSQAKVEKLISRKKMIVQNEFQKQNEHLKAMNRRLKLARKRREYMAMERRVEKMHEQIAYCKTHSAFRQEALLKNIKLLEMYEEEHRRNVEARKKNYERDREYNERKMIKFRKDKARKERYVKMVDKIMKHLEPFRKKCKESADPANSQEVIRRLSLFKPDFIADCVYTVGSMLEYLKISVPPAAFAVKTMRLMELRSIVEPRIGTSKCVFVREKTAEIVADTINDIQDARFEEMLKKWNEFLKKKAEAAKGEKSVVATENQSKNGSSKPSGSMSPAQSRTTTPRPSKVLSSRSVEKSIQKVNALEDNEFVGNLSEITGSINAAIENELDRFFEIICRSKFEFSPLFSNRDFVHVYSFQKHYVHESIKFFMEYVKIKQKHYWKRITDLNAWILLDKTYSNMNLWESSLEAADLLMKFPNNIEELRESIKKMSKFICVLLNDHLEKENIVDVDMYYKGKLP